MSRNESIQWQPLSQLSFLAVVIGGMLESLEENLKNLKAVRERIGSMDDATLNRVISVYTQQQEGLWLYEEQLARWKKEPTTEAQNTEIAKLTGQLERMRTGLALALSLAKPMKEYTIEKILAKDDVALALEMLSGKLDLPKQGGSAPTRGINPIVFN